MKQVHEIKSLTADELGRVQATLRRRFKVGSNSNIVDVGFGIAEKNCRLDANRTDAVCIYVRRKYEPKRKRDQVPKTVDVRVLRDGCYLQLKLPTDVIHLPNSMVHPTGRTLGYATDASVSATAGTLIAWKVPISPRYFWGVVTVGHVFQSISQVPETVSNVRIRIASGRSVAATLIARTKLSDNSRIDAAIVLVNKQALIDQSIVPADVSTKGRQPRSLADLQRDIGKAGFSLPARQKLPFKMVRYLPSSRIVATLGSLSDVIEVVGDADRSFSPGTSGSLWQISQQGASIQHGALSPHFRRGWGQCLATILDWCTQRLAEIHGVVEEDVDLRLIYAI